MWADRTRAAFQLRHHLRRPGPLESWERRLVAAGVYALAERIDATLGEVPPTH